MEAHYTLSEGDYLAANRAHVRLLFATGTGWVIPLLAGLANGFIIAGQWADTVPRLFATALPIAAAIAGVVWLILVVATTLAMRHTSRRFYRQQRLLGEATTIAWDAAGFRTASLSATSQVAWGDVRRWIESDALLLLFTNDLIFYPLPRDALGVAGSADIARQLVTHDVPQWRAWRHLRRPTRTGADDD